MKRSERIIIAEAITQFLTDRGLYTRENLVCLLKETVETQRKVLEVVAADIVANDMEYIGCYDRTETEKQAKEMPLSMLLGFLEDSLPCVWEHTNYYGVNRNEL